MDAIMPDFVSLRDKDVIDAVVCLVNAAAAAAKQNYVSAKCNRALDVAVRNFIRSLGFAKNEHLTKLFDHISGRLA